MSRLTSQHFVDCTSELLKEHNGGDVSLSMILEACGAQKGSLYHFFPGGKDELFTVVVERMRRCVLNHLRQCMETSNNTAEGLKKHLHFVARLIESPDSDLGMPFLALAATVGENTNNVKTACIEALREIESFLAKQIVDDGLPAKEAKRLSAFAVASIEGAILLARVRGNSSSIKLAAEKITELISP